MQYQAVFLKYIETTSSGYVAMLVKRVMCDNTVEYAVCRSDRHRLIPLSLTEGAELVMSVKAVHKPYSAAYIMAKHYTVESLDLAGSTKRSSAIFYLSHLGVCGLTHKIVEDVVDLTGCDIVGWFDTHNQSELTQIKGISDKRAAAIARKVLETSIKKAMYDTMYTYQFTYQQVEIIFNSLVDIYGIEAVKSDTMSLLRPKFNEDDIGYYSLCNRAGVEFRIADSFGKTLGYTAYTPERLDSYVLSLMICVENQGNTYATIDDLYALAKRYNYRTAYPEHIIAKRALKIALNSNPNQFCIEDNRVYRRATWRDENTIASELKRLKNVSHDLDFDEAVVDAIEHKRGIKFSTRQREAFLCLSSTGVKIITGGAGTGKTTVISGLIEAYMQYHHDATISLCAPTGRAAQRMTELCKQYGENARASTIHKLLNISPYDEASAEFNATHPLEADLIIVDEMSMVDTHIFAMLLSAIKGDALLLLCGDANQLPSVGCGKVLSDVIASGLCTIVQLKTTYRQTASSGNAIIENGNRIIAGNSQLIQDKNFVIHCCRDVNKMYQGALAEFKKNRDAVILTVTHDGVVGETTINPILQRIANPAPLSPVFAFADREYRNGDRIMMLRNNYKVGYVNGDVGVVTAIGSDTLTVDIAGTKYELTRAEIADMTLAYAMTIHKSQGSEYDSVIILLSDEQTTQGLLSRNTLYTAITRAKTNVTIYTVPGVIEAATQTIMHTRRRTTLKAILCNLTNRENEEALCQKKRQGQTL